MKKLTSLFLFLFLFFNLSPNKTFALEQWTPAEYFGVLKKSQKEPKIFEKTESIFPVSKKYEFTSIPCHNSSCPGDLVCKLNASSDQEECAEEKFVVSFSFGPKTTDFNSSVSTEKIKSTTENLYQTYENLLPNSQLLERKLYSALWAYRTKNFVEQGNKFPINGFPYKTEVILENGNIIQAGEFYPNLPSYVKNESKNWQAKILSDSNPYSQALVNFDYAPRGIEETAWLQWKVIISILGEEIVFPPPPLPGFISDYTTTRYSDVYLAILNNQIRYPNKFLKEKYEELSKEYPLINYFLNTDSLIAPTEEASNLQVSQFIDAHSTTQDSSIKSVAYSKNPAKGISLTFNKTFGDKIDVKIQTKNLITPTGTLLPKLMNLSTKSEFTSKQPSTVAEGKTLPVETSLSQIEVSEDRGGNLDLVKTYSFYQSCLSKEFASPEIDPGDWASGVRSTGVCLDSSSNNNNGNLPAPASLNNVCSGNCNSNPTQENLSGVQPKLKDLAQRWLGGAGQARTDKFNQIVSASQQAGVSPIFTLAIWLHESGASNYQGICKKLGNSDPSSGYCREIQDFGINMPSISTKINANGQVVEDHFQEQLNAWLGLPHAYLSKCQAEFAQNECAWDIFGSVFFPGTCTPNNKGSNYSKEVLGIYQSLSSQTPPCYPVKLP